MKISARQSLRIFKRVKMTANVGENPAIIAIHPKKLPDIPGVESFQGEWFHSARWDHDYDLRRGWEVAKLPMDRKISLHQKG